MSEPRKPFRDANGDPRWSVAEIAAGGVGTLLIALIMSLATTFVSARVFQGETALRLKVFEREIQRVERELKAEKSERAKAVESQGAKIEQALRDLRGDVKEMSRRLNEFMARRRTARGE
jgi:septal ring factor EnvC (AmiA/AmiB activator)